MVKKSSVDLSGLQVWLNETLLYEAEQGLEKIAQDIAARASTLAPRSKRKTSQPVRFEYLPVETGRTVPTQFINRETGGFGRSWASNVSTKTSFNPDGRVLGWKVQAFTAGKKRGSEVSYPVEDVVFTKKTKRSPGRAVTGPHLADSIESRGVEGEGNKLSVTVTADRPYAIYVEKGTKKMSGRHYMAQALRDYASDLEAGRIFIKK